MATRAAVLGTPNSGKTYSWKFYDNPNNDVFCLCPTAKVLWVRNNGKPLEELHIAAKGKGNSIAEIQDKLGVRSPHAVITAILKHNVPMSDLKIAGDYVVCSDMKYYAAYKEFVGRYMYPKKKIILTTDFTHLISHLVSTPHFRGRKHGGDAYAKYYDMAADALENILESSDLLPRDMLDVTEFHAAYDENFDTYKFLVPFGKMLSEKFKPETYFDLVFHTYIVPYEAQPDDSKRYKFVITRKGKYDGRSMGLFAAEADDGMIPNNMGMIIDKLRSESIV